MNDARVEHRHPSVVEETWWFCAAADGVGVHASLTLRPGQQQAWWSAALVRAGEPLVTISAFDIALPPRGLEIRTDGIWACLTCETPMEHWSVGLESFAVEVDEPDDERGDLVAFGLDLEWEAVGPGRPDPAGAGYGQACDVSGEVLLGADRIDLTAGGHRRHLWGTPAPRVDLAGTGADGSRWWRSGPDATDGFAVDEVGRSPVAFPDRPATNTLCRMTADSGETGWGWLSRRL